MNIISTTDISHEGNDCYINESVTLASEFELYFVVRVKKVSGWAPYESATIDYYPTADLNEAIKYYEAQGGKYETLD